MTDLILYLSLFFNVCLTLLLWLTVKQERLNEEIIDDLHRAYSNALLKIKLSEQEQTACYLDPEGRWRSLKTGQFVKDPLIKV